MSAPSAATAEDRVPLGERLVALQAVRTVLVSVVVAAALLDGRDMGRRGVLLAMCAGYALASAGLELTRKVAGRRTLPIMGSMLFVDVLFLGGALVASGGSQSRLVFLIYLHLVAVTLLLSFRTGLKLAFWHSLVLFVGHYTRAAGLVTPPAYLARLGESSADLTRNAVIASIGFWLVAIVTAALSALTERELRRGKVELRALAAMGARMESATSTDEVLEVLSGSVSDGFGFRRAVALAVDGDAVHAVLRDGRVTVGIAPGVGMVDAVVERAWAHRQPVLVRHLDATDDGMLDELLPLATNVVVLPMVAEGQRIGALAVEYGGSPRSRVRSRLVAMLEQFAVHAALELRNLWLLAEVRRLATTDALTGLANRRVMQDALDREVARAQRNGTALSVVMLDIDHFKAINDGHGHQTGDVVLQLAGRAVAAGLRASDLAARYGGEEFCLVLPDCDADEALAIAERVRAAVASCGSPMPVTMSGGVATLSAAEASSTGLLHAADAALYESKRNGRNRTTVAKREKRRRRRLASATLVA